MAKLLSAQADKTLVVENTFCQMFLKTFIQYLEYIKKWHFTRSKLKKVETQTMSVLRINTDVMI